MDGHPPRPALDVGVDDGVMDYTSEWLQTLVCVRPCTRVDDCGCGGVRAVAVSFWLCATVGADDGGRSIICKLLQQEPCCMLHADVHVGLCNRALCKLCNAMGVTL